MKKLLLGLLMVNVACTIQGPPGRPGGDGTGCSVQTVPVSAQAPNGGSVIECGDGSESLLLNGTNGNNGAPGTVISAIQFCPGAIPTYPSTYAEVGFCIQGQIYSVYSANGGFLTLVTPGQYSSDGENASCTFTIGSNCQVSN